MGGASGNDWCRQSGIDTSGGLSAYSGFLVMLHNAITEFLFSFFVCCDDESVLAARSFLRMLRMLRFCAVAPLLRSASACVRSVILLQIVSSVSSGSYSENENLHT